MPYRALALLCALAVPLSPALAKKPAHAKGGAKSFVHPCTKNPPVELLRCSGAHDGNDYAIEKCGPDFFASSWKDGKSLERWPVHHSKAGGADHYKTPTTGFELSVKGGKAGHVRVLKKNKPDKVTCSAGGGGSQKADGGAQSGGDKQAKSGGGSSGSQGAAHPAPHSAKCGFCYGTALKTKPQWDSDLSDSRRKILETAEGFLHKVSDCGGSGSEKYGADVLADIYKTAFGSLDSATEKNVRKANNKSWKSGPWSWCGIFAAAVMKKAGFDDISWGVGKLKGRTHVAGNKGVKPGDIAFWQGGLNHHDIVEKIEGSTVYTIDGNQECSGIMRKKRKLGDMAGYYKIAND